MKQRPTARIEQAAKYYDEGFRAIFKQWQTQQITLNQFESKMNEHKGHAEELCRKQIIWAFDHGFKFGVRWHVEMSETNQTIERDCGVEYYRNIYEGGDK
jgi:hypothetical protein